MKNKKKKSYAPIRIAGSAAIIGMAGLTAFSVNSLLNYLNNEADREYWAAFNANRPAVVSEAPTNNDKLVAEVPDSTTDIPAVTTAPEVTTVPEETEPVVTTAPKETKPEVTTVPEKTEPEVTTVPEETKPDITTDPDKPDPGVKDPEKDKDIKEPDDNHGNNSDDNVVVGKAFDLTGCSLDSAGNLVYTVQRGDCLSKIGRQFEVDYREIGTRNHIADLNMIHAGERFVIPVSAEMLAYAQANLK